MTSTAAAPNGEPATLHRLVAQGFSTRVIRELARPRGPWPLDRIQAVIDCADRSSSLADAFDAAYTLLERQYRCEYVIKNALIQQRTDVAESRSVNAFVGLPVRMSIADVVVVDEHATAYEIKTDLDSFTRLDLQLFDYSMCFEHVYVVTSETKGLRALDAAPSHVGVLLTTDTGAISVARAAQTNHDRLDQSSLFRILRKNERLAIAQRHYGYVVDVPSARLYQRLAGLFAQLPLEIAYREFVTELRTRDSRCRQAAREANLPQSLRAAAYAVALSPLAWRRLGIALQRPAADFIIPAPDADRQPCTPIGL